MQFQQIHQIRSRAAIVFDNKMETVVFPAVSTAANQTRQNSNGPRSGDGPHRLDNHGAAKTSWAERRNRGAAKSRCPDWIAAVRTEGSNAVPPVRFAEIPTAERKFVLIPGRAAVIKRIFELLASGLSPRAIAAKFNEEEVPAWHAHKSKAGWRGGYIQRLRRNRAVMGEFQPHVVENGARVPAGPVITNFYPAVVSPDLWRRAWEAKEATGLPGRNSAEINLFRGLVYSRKDGTKMGTKDTCVRAPHREKPARYTYLVSRNRSADPRRLGTHRIRYQPLEETLLFWMRCMGPALFAAAAEDPERDQVNQLAAAREHLEEKEKSVTDLLTPVDRALCPALPEQLLVGTVERDRARARVLALESGKLAPVSTPEFHSSVTVAQRRRLRIEIAKVIKRIEVGRDGGAMIIHSALLPPIVLSPGGYTGEYDENGCQILDEGGFVFLDEASAIEEIAKYAKSNELK